MVFSQQFSRRGPRATVCGKTDPRAAGQVGASPVKAATHDQYQAFLRVDRQLGISQIGSFLSQVAHTAPPFTIAGGDNANRAIVAGMIGRFAETAQPLSTEADQVGEGIVGALVPYFLDRNDLRLFAGVALTDND